MTDTYELPPDDLPPVNIDRERMDKALAGPFYTLPHGLTSEQLRQCMDTLSQAVNDAATRERERERIARFIEDEYERQFIRPWRQDLAAAIRKG